MVVREAVHLDCLRGMIQRPPQVHGKRFIGLPVEGELVHRASVLPARVIVVTRRLVETELRRHDDEDEAMFAARFHLVHEWRKFLFTDPGLPADLLPRDWAGRVAEDLFHLEATRLEPGATRFLVRCLAG